MKLYERPSGVIIIIVVVRIIMITTLLNKRHRSLNMD